MTRKPSNSTHRDISADTSVMVPTLNRADLLAQTLDSLVAQTVACRIVVIDNGSTDHTEQVCRAFRPAVDYVREDEKLDLFANWNRGLRGVDTEFVAIYHDDDVYHPEIISEEVDLLRRHPEMVMAHTGCHFIDDDGRITDTYVTGWPSVMPGPAFQRVLGGLFSCPVAAPSVMLRTAAIRELGGFDETLRVSGDLAAWFGLAELGSVGYVSRPLVSVRTRGRYANEHARFDWGVIDEHLTIAARTESALEGRLDWRFRARADWYLFQLLLHEVLYPSGTDPSSVVRRHGGQGTRLLARLLPRLGPLRPFLRALRPAARRALVYGGRVHRRLLPHQAVALKSRWRR